MPKCEICRNPRFAFAAVFAIFLTFATGAFDQAQAAFDITEDFSAMTVPVNGHEKGTDLFSRSSEAAENHLRHRRLSPGRL